MHINCISLNFLHLEPITEWELNISLKHIDMVQLKIGKAT
jgi:hypothetical protein